jgi:thiamine pyrophosphate-dependent acetolactate synthase large subunit-like protein
VADKIASERLIDWGVDTVFGPPGDGINGIMEGLRRHKDRIRFSLVRHEEAAAFMATGYAKSTGRLGVCLATSSPGGIHLLNGLYDAKLDHTPVLALTGRHFAPFAESCGALGIEVEKAEGVEPAVRRALEHDGPALVDVMVNPDEPLMPGKVTYEQAKGFAQAWLRGQPRSATMASTLFRDKVEQLRN